MQVHSTLNTSRIARMYVYLWSTRSSDARMRRNARRTILFRMTFVAYESDESRVSPMNCSGTTPYLRTTFANIDQWPPSDMQCLKVDSALSQSRKRLPRRSTPSHCQRVPRLLKLVVKLK